MEEVRAKKESFVWSWVASGDIGMNINTHISEYILYVYSLTLHMQIDRHMLDVSENICIIICELVLTLLNCLLSRKANNENKNVFQTSCPMKNG